MSNTKNYTAADFARYHAGAMPAAEMHALEKAALDDPFLEDALEGYSIAHTPAQDVTGLKERISNAAAPEKVFFLSPKRGWWRIAALLIIMAGAGYLFFWVNNNAGPQHNLAKNENAAPASTHADSAAPVAVAKDTAYKINPGTVSAATTVTPLNITIPPAQNNQWTATQQSGTYAYTPSQQADESAPVSAPPANAAAGNMAASPYDPAKSAQLDYYQNVQSNQAVNDISRNNNALNNNALNNAGYNKIYNNGTLKDQNGISTAPANLSNATDDKARYKLNIPDSLVIAKNTTPAKKPVASNVLTDRRMLDSDAVVTTAAGVKRQAKENTVASASVISAETISIPSGKSTGKVSEVGLADRSSVPSSGQTAAEKAAFDKYIKDNMQPVYDQAGKRLAGEVLLSFVVKKSRPKNIKVAMSLCQPCEAQAKMLLENGPDWSGKKNEERTVIIKF